MAEAAPQVRIIGVPGMPEVERGSDLPALIAASIERAGLRVEDGDVLVVTSKIVSKALGLYADPAAARAGLVLRESSGVVAERRTADSVTRVVAAAAGPVMAGAGIDASNASTGSPDDLLLLPRDPDAVAADLHVGLAHALGGTTFAVLLSDTSGRAWRMGLTDFALGASGFAGIDDLRGLTDTRGRDLAVTVRNLADEVAAAADLVKGKLSQVPVAVVRGLSHLVRPVDQGTPARDLVRTGPGDWFSLGRAEAVRDALGIPAGSALSEQVGIESAAPEPVSERVTRAVRVALAAGDDVGIDLGGSAPGSLEMTLDAADGVALGRVWARLEVALAGERVWVTSAIREGSRVRLTAS